MLLKEYYFSFSAVPAFTFKWPMVELLQKQEPIIWLTAPAVNCDQLKTKRNIKSIVWKQENGKYSTWNMKRIWRWQCEFADGNIKRWDGIALLIHIYTLLRF